MQNIECNSTGLIGARMQNESQAMNRRTRSSFIAHRSSFARGFTLTEILIVITIIVIMLGLAMPVFRYITGSKSEEGAANHISAFLARARNNAIGLQEEVGVFLFADSDGLPKMALVRHPSISVFVAGSPTSSTNYKKYDYVYANGNHVYVCLQDYTENNSTNHSPPAWGTYSSVPAVSDPPTSADYWAPADWNAMGTPSIIDQIEDTEIEALPRGVGVQLVNEYRAPAGIRITDGYITNGAIFFDRDGNLKKESICVARLGRVGPSLVWGNTNSDQVYPHPNSVYGGVAPRPTPFPLYSAFGLVLFNRDAFLSQGFTAKDWQTLDPSNWPTSPPAPPTSYGSSGSGNATDEYHEEDWLDKNASPLLINRYNGTLIRTE